MARSLTAKDVKQWRVVGLLLNGAVHEVGLRLPRETQKQRGGGLGSECLWRS